MGHSKTLLEATHSPDIILTVPNSEANWSQLISVIKVQWKDTPELLMTAILQLGDQATFVFHHQLHCQRFSCLSLCRISLRISVFTCGGSLHYKALDISSDPKVLSKVMDYFKEAELLWLGYNIHIIWFLPTAVQVWDDKQYWQNEEENGAACDNLEFHLVGHLPQSIGMSHCIIEYCIPLTSS